MNEKVGTPVTALALVRRLRAAGCVFAEREAALIAATFLDPGARENATVRRERGEPLEHVLGVADFAGVTVSLGPGCFVPRARAVALVDAAELEAPGSACIALDLGCGCGAIAAALKQRHPSWKVLATDVDESALAWARRNAERFGFTVQAGSWFSAVPPSLHGRLDVVVAHLPYVPTAEIALLPRDFRDHEPVRTVDGGVDGLDPLRAVVAQVRDWLSPDGVLLSQLTHEQHPTAVDLAATAGLTATTVLLTVPPDPGRPDHPADAADDEADGQTLVIALRLGEARR